jgi:ParB family chromosome partitioning protein
VQKHFPANRSPFAASHPWNVLLEISAPVSEAEGRAALEALLEAALEQDLADALGLKVQLADRGGKGELTITYGTLEQLDDLCRRLMRG